jgi:hypothetical protein
MHDIRRREVRATSCGALAVLAAGCSGTATCPFGSYKEHKLAPPKRV